MGYLWLSGGLILAGAVAIFFTHKQAYDKGITTAVLLHRNGRLKYRDYYDEHGEKMVDIVIDPIDED